MPLVLLTALVLSASPSAPLAPAEVERFKAFVLEGEKQFGEGDYGAAIWNFRQADAIKITPEVAFNLAKAHEKIEDQPTAAFYYRLYLRRAPEATDALEVAEILGDLLSRAEAEGRGLVEVDATVPGQVILDGREFVETPAAIFMAPGEYELVAKFKTGTERRTISVLTGRTVTLVLEPLPPPLLDADGSEAFVATAARGQSGGGARGVLHISSMAVMGLSAVALAAGSVFGVMSSTESGRLQSQKSTLTVTQAQTLARSAGSKGATANVLWAAGGAGLAAGGVMFVMTLPEPGSKAASTEGEVGR